jgi:ribosome-associated protein
LPDILNFARSDGRSPIISEPTEAIRSAQQQCSLEHACLCAKIAEEYRGQDTLVLDLTNVTPIFDFFVLTTGASKRQMHAIAEEADRVLQSDGSRRNGIEGNDSSSWILQDYGDVVFHIFTLEARGIYDLEHLWSDAVRIDWQAVNESSKPSL